MGTRRAALYWMAGAKHYEELIAWQLADQVSVHVLTLTARDRFSRDLKLHSQTEDAVNSVCRNIAEGFGCKHVEFARFLKVSRRSLNELRDAFRAAQLKRYVTPDDYAPIAQLSRRLYPALSRLIAYLESTPDPIPASRNSGPRSTSRTTCTPCTPCTPRTPRTPRTDRDS